MVRVPFAGRCALTALLACGCLPAAVAQSGPALSATDIAGLYQAGVQARLAGRMDEALDLLSRAAAAAPDNVDVLLQEGLVLMAKGRDNDAAALFQRVLSLAPGYKDARLALARIARRRGDIDTALAQVDIVLRDAPHDAEARELHANLLLAKGDARDSESEYRALAHEQTGDASALIGLGDSLRAQWRDDDARAAYREAATLAPDSVASQRAMLPDHQRFRLDVGGAYSHLSNGSPAWKEGSVRLAYSIDDRNVIAAGSDVSHRFDTTNVYSELRLDHRYSDRLSVYVYGGGTPDASILPKVAAGTGVQWRLDPVAGKRSTFATLDMRYARYDTARIWSGSVGAIQYLGDDTLWVTAKWVNTLDERNRYLTGYTLRADWQAWRWLRLLAGFADAPESDQGVTVRTRAFYAGAVFDVSDSLAINVSAARELRPNLYDRNVVGLGMTVKF
ncbi:YaiO family outer membrane beta-barrel protein [Burkholderia sp. Ac-20353]|uniref:YaiO family outer membrane beta-barrel protein n=1 Tax=Burkholderia sp. Ac-20353 TaxID=2703894 RepID=UPI00197B9373|nr:YaiO family outer membrane beta-barrel protein [Burkholderia sp. Ac-20353]MBN3787862.1 YaiO family outer membrane beta-barrel protein [Burkholderia sp. Ac-20353]